MKSLIALQVTIFTMVVVGALMIRLKLISKEGRKSITNLVIYVVLPCNIFKSFLTDITAQQMRDCFAVFAIAAVIQIVLYVYGKFRYKKYPEDEKKNLQYAMLISNAGFMGFPMAEGVFGSLGLLMASIYVIPQRIMMWTNGLAIYEGSADWKVAVKKVLTHPCIIACELGILWAVAKLPMPEVVLKPIQTLSNCNTALSMMIVGFVLGEMEDPKIVNKKTVIFTIERLITIPLVVWIGCRLLGIGHEATGVCTLLAGMPAAAMTSVMASKYDRNPGFATQMVILSTLCSIPTILIWGMILK